MPSVTLIWAQSSNGAIGKDNKLLFRSEPDLIRFKELTMGKVVIMGRKTWESLPEKVRPLPGRYNVILTRDKTFTVNNDHVEVIHDLKAFLDLHKKRDICIIGGGEIYNLAMPFATRICYTCFDAEAQGDTFAPPIDVRYFRLEHKSELIQDEKLGIKLRFVKFVRRNKPFISSHHVVVVRRHPPTKK